MTWLASLSTEVLVVVWLGLFSGAALLARWGLRRLVPPDHWRDTSSVAGPLMPALGAAFALLAALSLAGQATETRAAETDVSLEAAAAARLSWATTNPGLDTTGVQKALVTYLEATRTGEWSLREEHGDPATLTALATLEGAVRDAAATPGLGSAQSSELLTSLGTLTSLRRTRLATASHTLPGFYVAVVVMAGLALVVNSAALALTAAARVALVTVGLVAIVGLAVALLFALAAPFSGGFVVSDAPLVDVIADLHSGLFHA